MCREALIEYEEALALEARLDDFEGNGPGDGFSSVKSKTPAGGFKMPRTPTSAAKGKGKGKENAPLDAGADDQGNEEGPTVQKARLVKEIFEVAYPKWRHLIAIKGHEEGRPAGLERFDSGESCHNIFVVSGPLAEVRRLQPTYIRGLCVKGPAHSGS